MGKHDKTYEKEPIEWYINRIKSLEAQLENAQRKVAMQEHYIGTLEKDRIKTANRVASLERAVLRMAVE